MPRPVHPRIRGERVRAIKKYQTAFGSSPHTRGTRDRVPDRDDNGRFIPAYAGNALWRMGL